MNEVPMLLSERAEILLRELARAHPGGMRFRDIEPAATAQGISARTLSRAALKLGVIKFRGGRHGSIWRWPPSMTEQP